MEGISELPCLMATGSSLCFVFSSVAVNLTSRLSVYSFWAFSVLSSWNTSASSAWVSPNLLENRTEIELN